VGVEVAGPGLAQPNGQEGTQHKKLPPVDAIAALDHATADARNSTDLLISPG
jgi:hypothetical protein